MKAIKLLLAYIAGIFVLPFLLLITNFNSKKLKFLDSIFGNSQDGLGWDFLENSAITMPSNMFTRKFPRYYWLAIRNPAHNLGRSYGANGIIESVWRNKDNEHELGTYRSTMTIDDVEHKFFYSTKKIGSKYLRIAYGPKLWALNPKIVYNTGDVLQHGNAYRNFWKVGDEIHEGFAMSIAIRDSIT